MRNRVPVPASERQQLPEFAPVPRKDLDDRWTPGRQKAFIEALADCGSLRRTAAQGDGLRLRRQFSPRTVTLRPCKVTISPAKVTEGRPR